MLRRFNLFTATLAAILFGAASSAAVYGMVRFAARDPHYASLIEEWSTFFTWTMVVTGISVAVGAWGWFYMLVRSRRDATRRGEDLRDLPRV